MGGAEAPPFFRHFPFKIGDLEAHPGKICLPLIFICLPLVLIWGRQSKTARREGKIGRREVFPKVKNVNVESLKIRSKLLDFLGGLQKWRVGGKEKGRDKESKRGREEETKSQRVKESKRRREEESRSQRVKESRSQREEETEGRGASTPIAISCFTFVTFVTDDSFAFIRSIREIRVQNKMQGLCSASCIVLRTLAV